MPSPSSEVYFYHIPKTAGTTLGKMLRRAYPQEECIPAYNASELMSMPLDQIPRYRCYAGHFYSLLDGVLGRALPAVTLLRDPFEQTVSVLNYSSRYQLEWGLAALPICCAPFAWNYLPFLRKPIERHVFPYLMNNFQVRVLGSDLREYAKLRGACSSFPRVELYFKTNNIEECFERAVERLNAMALVGTVERIAESTELIFDLIGAPQPKEIPHDNAAKRANSGSYRTSGTVSKELAELIDSETEYDQRLYKIACDRLNASLAKKQSAEGL